MNRRRFLNRLFGLTVLLPAAVVAWPRAETRSALTLLTTKVAGSQYYQGEQIRGLLKPGDSLRLQRQPDNPYDSRAVEVYWRDHKLGYIPRSDNAVIAQLLDNGTRLQARITGLEDDDNPWNRIRFPVYASV